MTNEMADRGLKQRAQALSEVNTSWEAYLIAVNKCDIISMKANVICIRRTDAFDASPVLDLTGAPVSR